MPPPKFAQDNRGRVRPTIPDVPIQPHVLAAAEMPYRVNHAIPPRPTYQQFPKAGSSSATASTSNTASSGASYPPYRQRLVAAALATPDDPASSNDSSSAPSSNAVSSGVGPGSTTSTSSQDISKGKAKSTTSTSPFAPTRTPPSVLPAPAPTPDSTDLDSDASYFEQLMERHASALPAPGLSYFEQRRAIWKESPPNPPEPSSPSPSRVKLEALLSQAGAVESEEVWRAGLKNVWKGLVGGNQLRKRLPLATVLKILQAGWLRDGTWPEGMVAQPWEQPMTTHSPHPPSRDDPSQAQSQAQSHSQQQRRTHEQEAFAAALHARAHEQEAFAAALHARASAEQANESAQMMHIQAYAMMGMSGIPPGYSPSSGDVPEEGYYMMPYEYAQATPPPPGREAVPERECEQQGRDGEREMEEVPPPTPVHPAQEMESEMDTDDEVEEEEDVTRADDGWRMKGIVRAGDGRHEGG